MAVYMVERELPGVTMDQLSAAQKAAIATSEGFSAAGKTVRYIRAVHDLERKTIHLRSAEEDQKIPEK